MKKRNFLIFKSFNLSIYGFSQVEIMVTILVISIVILGIITTFGTIGKGLITSKTRTIANNLAQEKIETLKNVSYARLLTTSESDLMTYGYDNTNVDYTPESLRVGDANFIRYTTVWKARESGTEISTMTATAEDEGIKKIKMEVKWVEGAENKSLVLYNLRDDPNRKTLSGKVYGLVTTTGTPVGISGANVEIVQDINRNDLTSTTGFYMIKTTSPATIQLNVSRAGYWPKESANIVVSAETNIQLTAKEIGNANGFVYKRDHLVISEVCGGLTDNTTEYVELYNPTTYWIRLMSGGAIFMFKLRYVDSANNCADFPFLTNNIGINGGVPSHGYVLIASQQAVNGVTADFCYSAGGQDIIKTSVMNGEGGIGLLAADASLGGTDVWIDSVAWSPGANHATKAVEGNFFNVAEFDNDDSIERLSYSTYTWVKMVGDTNGNAYDTNNNSTDWVYHHAYANPQNTNNSEIPVLGTPVFQAVVSANDGLSNTTTTSSTGYYYLTGIATGTVTIYSSSLTLSGLVPDNNITTGGNTRCDIILSSTSEGGFISGRVIRGDTLAGVSGITVSAGSYSAPTNSSGYYGFAVDVGSYTVIANPDYTSTPDGAKWTSGSSEDAANATVEVNFGKSVTINPDLKIYPAGWISGTTYNATGGLLPYITIRTTSTAASFSKDVVSGTNGTYIIKGAKTATDYQLYPVLDEADSYICGDPVWTVPVTVTAGVESSGKNFKITSAWGKITGRVSDTAIGGNITTGVLIVATIDVVPADAPPPIDSSFRGGTSVYYGTISISDGTYEIAVRKGWTYNMRAWYTKITGDTGVITTSKTGVTPTLVNDTYPTVTVDFQWP
ncbi:MAG: carboxypeptidase-like regulatory domain-containing protein [Elusimicrobia bacterium]|nr:carboxypeptidase-like regulatory domain-containing protein [Elusimicrobiota bacterium]